MKLPPKMNVYQQVKREDIPRMSRLFQKVVMRTNLNKITDVERFYPAEPKHEVSCEDVFNGQNQ